MSSGLVVSELGTPRPRKYGEYIVEHVLTPSEIQEFDWTFLTIIPKLMENEAQFAASLGLISNCNKCETCEVPRVLRGNYGRTDGFQWCCPVGICASYKAIRAGSFLEGSHLKIKQIIMLLCCWSLNMSQTLIKKQISVSQRTIIDWMQFIREVCEQDILNNPIMLGGIDENSNTAKEVEIDKSFFFKKKYMKGPMQDDVWVFCAVERETHRCNLTTVKRKDRDALFPIVRSWLLPGTRIISDGWADYEGLDQFEHITYEHKHNCARENIQKLSGGRHGLNTRDLHLVEFMWRHREKGEVFPRIIQCIRDQYSFDVSS